MPCKHDAAKDLLGIGRVHTVFLLVPVRSTHEHRHRLGESEVVGGGEAGKTKINSKDGAGRYEWPPSNDFSWRSIAYIEGFIITICSFTPDSRNERIAF